MLSSLLILLPLVLLLLAAAGLLILHRFIPSFGLSWLIAAFAALFAWVSVLLLKVRIPISVELLGWQPARTFLQTPSLCLDSVSWPYALGLAALVLAVILTATARYQFQTHPSAWAGSLGMTALGLVAVMSANPLTLILAWTLIDLVEFIILLANIPDRSLSARPVIGFATRVAGTMIIFGATITADPGVISPGVFTTSPDTNLFYLLGVGLRLGVFPLHLTFPQELPMRRGLGNVLRLVPAVSSLVVLARIPAIGISTTLTPLLLGLTALAAFYASILWATCSDELNGRPYWLISLAALSITGVIRGMPADSLTWGLAILLSGGLLFLYSAGGRRLIILPLLGLWGFSGLPFSPVSNAWAGLTGEPYPAFNLIYLASHALLIFGYLRHAYRPGDSLSSMERWVYLTYPAGLLLLPVVQIGLGLGNITDFDFTGFWWVGIVTTALGFGGMFWFQKAPRQAVPIEGDIHGRWYRPAARRLLSFFTYYFRFDWLYRLTWGLYQGFGKVVTSLTTILEGEGGVLWVFVLLALFLTLLRAGGNP